MAVSHSEFWQRYFYKVHRLEQVGQRGCLPGGWALQPRSSNPDQRGRKYFSWKSSNLGCLLCSLVVTDAEVLWEGKDWGCELTLNSLQDEARREALKQRAEQSIHQEEPGWEEDEGGSDGWGPAGGLSQTLAGHG